jgi:hypothetical protein
MKLSTMTLFNRFILCLVALSISCVWFVGAFATLPAPMSTMSLRVRRFMILGQVIGGCAFPIVVHILLLSLFDLLRLPRVKFPSVS